MDSFGLRVVFFSVICLLCSARAQETQGTKPTVLPPTKSILEFVNITATTNDDNNIITTTNTDTTTSTAPPTSSTSTHTNDGGGAVGGGGSDLGRGIGVGVGVTLCVVVVVAVVGVVGLWRRRWVLPCVDVDTAAAVAHTTARSRRDPLQPRTAVPGQPGGNFYDALDHVDMQRDRTQQAIYQGLQAPQSLPAAAANCDAKTSALSSSSSSPSATGPEVMQRPRRRDNDQPKCTGPDTATGTETQREGERKEGGRKEGGRTEGGRREGERGEAGKDGGPSPRYTPASPHGEVYQNWTDTTPSPPLSPRSGEGGQRQSGGDATPDDARRSPSSPLPAPASLHSGPEAGRSAVLGELHSSARASISSTDTAGAEPDAVQVFMEGEEDPEGKEDVYVNTMFPLAASAHSSDQAVD